MKNNNDYCTMYIVRHGETEWNLQRRSMGHLDSPLTEKGLEQARQAGEALKEIRFDAIFSSDLLRAKRTADIIRLERELAIVTAQELRERSFGEYEGRPREENAKRLYEILDTLGDISEEERSRIRLGKTDENEEEVCIRFIRFLREIAVAHIGKTILVVTHGGPMRLLLQHLGFGHRRELLGAVGNAAHIRLACDGVDFVIEHTEGIVKNPDYENVR